MVPDISHMSYQSKKKLLTEALRVVLVQVLKTHAYDFAGAIKLQRRGGPIGMELTGVIAHVFMVWWDRRFKERLHEVQNEMKLHKRYVDDSNVVTLETQIGARYNGERLMITDETKAYLQIKCQ